MIYCSIPLVIVFSLCYAATRHEDMRRIFRHALHFGGGLTLFLVVVLIIMEILYRLVR